jgi:hypothetical protein
MYATPKISHWLELRHRSIPPAKFRHSAEWNGATKQQKKFAGALAKLLSAGQKETGKPGIFEPYQIITPKKTFIKWALCRFLPGGCPGWHRHC